MAPVPSGTFLYSACRGTAFTLLPPQLSLSDECTRRPLLVGQVLSQRHVPALAASHHITRRRQGHFVRYLTVAFSPVMAEYSPSPFPSWHAPKGSNSALLFSGAMSSQQDTHPKVA
ncbi:hypothetical protein SO802_031162 [Lithocarpus litseifolius]|uniref:Uncharacterized protein n=1 Tax=Lithocarpus litseifolius TaxID=425828 RepID=A0AAW2BJW2_9ROSI